MSFKSFLSDQSVERADAVVRAGLRVSKKNADFWAKFAELCGNAEGMSALLGVPAERVAAMPARVREAVERVSRQDSDEPARKNVLVRTKRTT